MPGRAKLLISALILMAQACGQNSSEPAANHYVLSFDTHELMEHVLDPAADVLWSSAGAIITEAGTQDLAPSTDEGWINVENHAAILMESANLLLLPGRLPSDTGINDDNEAWIEYSQALVTMAHKAKDAATARDADALFAAGADLYQVCLACHQAYDRDMPE